MVRPTSRGRQKIAMVKIKDKTHLGVTFTKRRNGIFKKANELVSLCGVELAIILYSPGNKAYSYGHPNVFTVLDRFLGDFKIAQINKFTEGNRKVKINMLYAQLKEIERLVVAEKKIAKELKVRVIQGHPIAMIPRDQLTYFQTLEFQGMLKELQLKIFFSVQQRLVSGATMDNAQNINLPMIENEEFVLNNLLEIPRSSYNLGHNFG
ncbi:hypothetical protein vseg_001918 [Gypsophila vaccaria]